MMNITKNIARTEPMTIESQIAGWFICHESIKDPVADVCDWYITHSMKRMVGTTRVGTTSLMGKFFRARPKILILFMLIWDMCC